MDTKVLDPTSGDDGAQVAEKENIFGSPDKKLEAEKIRRRKEESGEIKVTLKRILGFYSASIPVIKDSLDVAWKFAPIFLFFPAMMLWSYLRKIGWEQLFSDAVVSISGFIVMFVTACLLMFAVFVQFIFPSMIIGPVVSAYEEIAASGDEKFKDDLSRAVWRLHLSTPIGWLFILALSVIALDQPPWLAYTMSIVAAYVVALYFVIRNRNIFLRRIGGSPMPLVTGIHRRNGIRIARG
ncbi:hypothetical protein [Burkholderia savannae]|uniref:hypothetical protein n=1 Tax=Burkholderia savannae TaxID=1637837 RepID=UPI0008578A46|nr:hypothetical protein [Burkholderia savannae]AOJ68599.1 hypothetical protein WS78_07405 [Burkholderia savannae]